MDCSPLISVVVPVYNVEKYLIPCLDSLKNQSYSDLEIILIDDGSTDDSGKICDDYAAKDVRFQVIHKKNAGVSAARNTGIELAKGSYISFVDSDDRLQRDYFEVLYGDVLQNNADASFCNYSMIDENENLLAVPVPRFEKSELICEVEAVVARATQWGIVWGGLLPAGLVKKHRFSGLRYGEDSLFMFDLLRSGMKVYVDTYEGYLYLQRSDSATATNKIPLYAKAKDHLKVHAYRYLNLPEVSEQIKNEFFFRYALQLHKLAYIAAQTHSRKVKAECRDFVKEHLKNILPMSKILPLKLKMTIKLYAYFPWLYNIVVGIICKNERVHE